MVTDAQVGRLMKLIQTEETLAIAASKAGMDEKTARKYRDDEQLPSQMKTEHTWRTRPDSLLGTGGCSRYSSSVADTMSRGVVVLTGLCRGRLPQRRYDVTDI